MARKISVHRVCDRCGHPFDESQHKYGEALPKFETKQLTCKIVNGGDTEGTTAGEATLFHFDDLCPDCDRVVEGFIKKIKMESEEDASKGKKKKGEKTLSEDAKTPESAAQGSPPAQITELSGTVSKPESTATKTHPF